jgi:protein gp37
MGDVMDGEVPDSWRQELWQTIDQTPHLDWQLLTKRPENYHRFLPASFAHNNVWLGTTAEDQNYYDRRWPSLSRLRERFPQAPLWISYEPALGPLTMRGKSDRPDWIIFGGESGSGYRATNVQWAESIKKECDELGSAFFMKQMAARTTTAAKNLIPAELLIRNYPPKIQEAA